MEQAYFFKLWFLFQGAIFKNFICSVVFFDTKFNIDCKCGTSLPVSECLYDFITENREGMRAYFQKDFSTLSWRHFHLQVG